MKFVDFLIQQRATVIYSYYKLVNSTIILNVGRQMWKMGKPVCVFNGDVFTKFVTPDFPLECKEESVVLAYEVEDKSLAPRKFQVLTTYDKRLKFKDVVEVTVEKVSQNLYFASSIQSFRFRIQNQEIQEVSFNPTEREIISFLQEFGSSTIKEICDVISPRVKVTRETTRQTLLEMKRMGIVEIEGSKVSLNDDSRLQR